MKNILYHTLSLLFASLLFVACAKETIVASFDDQEGATLTLRLSNDKLQSRAEAGDDAYNENAITKVDLYLYPAGGTGQALHKVSRTFTDTKSEATITETLNNDLIETLFGTGNVCHAYALVNYPGTAPEAKTNASSIANLKAMEITADFTKTQESFVMDGESAAIAYNDGTKVVTGEVEVKRAASKIGFFVTGVDKTVFDDAGNTWEPDYKKMNISFHNGVNKAKVDVGYTADRPNNTLTTDNYYATSGNRNISIIEAKDNTDTYSLTTTHAPFYSYSSDWGRATNPDTEPTITLMVPWRKVRNNGDNADIPEADRTWQTCYYQIPVNVKSVDGSLTDCMERNMYYKISFHVGILGDFNPATPTIITASYYTVDWKTENVDVDIKNYKYLVVDKNDVTVYNENEVRIGYASSDAIKAEITYIRRPDYAKTVAYVDSTTYYGSLSNTSGKSSVSQGTNSLLRACTVTVEGNEIVLNHTIVNQSATSGTNYDYVPYYIWVKVTMTVQVNGNNKTFTEWIRYEQYPAVYVGGNKNSAYGTNTSTGNVYINKQDNNDTGGWDSVNGLGSGSSSSSSPYMYIITVTALPNDSEYIIADPRSTEINLLNYNNSWGSAPALYGTTPRRLTYYYPTLEGDDYENLISPLFRICSGYGRLSNNRLTQAEARRRCAAYQEDGYPAGRWRLPTVAELKFVGELCAEKKIPSLFSDGATYWCASGGFEYDYDNGTFDEVNSANFVRCVYDDWYWGEKRVESAVTTFTWGDVPRN